MKRFQPRMIGLGPYLPQHDTPFAAEPAESVEQTQMLIAIFRLMFPAALIPSTTALASLVPDCRERGILAGANVVMPNLSPVQVRERYAIYDNKIPQAPSRPRALHRSNTRLRRSDTI